MPLLRSVASRPSTSRVAALVTAHPRCCFSFSKPTFNDLPEPSKPALNDLPESRLNPSPDDYSQPSFADNAEVTLHAGRGGNGCIAFLREAHLPDGPPNGGDGGQGGNIYIQAAHGETSLHKLARQRVLRAGSGGHGQGKSQGGTRGEDIIITVPVGTIVRELERQDLAAEEAKLMAEYRKAMKKKRRMQRMLEEEKRRSAVNEQEDEGAVEDEEEAVDRRGRRNRAKAAFQDQDDDSGPEIEDPSRQKWLLHPGASKSEKRNTTFPPIPRRYAPFEQPPSPIYLDLSRPTPRPILLAVGGIGGLGNPHFTSWQRAKPRLATRGESGVSVKVSLELKLLADVGFVGLPNAGKSTLLRAMTNSRTRVGSWAFTTLKPNIGTVVLDKYSGRPTISRKVRQDTSPIDSANDVSSEVHVNARTRFTVADIPGLIEGAHLDRGLGIAFLRHVERAGVLAFVIDLSAGNAVTALKALWREVGLYAQMRDEEERERKLETQIDWTNFEKNTNATINLTDVAEYEKPTVSGGDAQAAGLHIAGKPWFVVATKGDRPDTEANFHELTTYLDGITAGEVEHPSGVAGAWTRMCKAIPVSAIQGQGIDRVVYWTVGLLDE
ncbi:hypothetical protein E4U24_005115 [Claviceps purpurea]|nr:hypothetical protein E4U28_005254 [Claviceps purpurea]KAG6256976.1 hypothetical protein E4U24_005115 [Claviceps purpurea]